MYWFKTTINIKISCSFWEQLNQVVLDPGLSQGCGGNAGQG